MSGYPPLLVDFSWAFYAAGEVFQDFALRFVRGDFYRLDPDQDKFRGFLKTVIGRMIIDDHRGKQRRRQREPQMPASFPSAVAPSPSTGDWLCQSVVTACSRSATSAP